MECCRTCESCTARRVRGSPLRKGKKRSATWGRAIPDTRCHSATMPLYAHHPQVGDSSGGGTAVRLGGKRTNTGNTAARVWTSAKAATLSAVQNTEIQRHRSATRALKSVCHFILTAELVQRFKRILIRILHYLSPIMAIYNFSTITWRTG